MKKIKQKSDITKNHELMVFQSQKKKVNLYKKELSVLKLLLTFTNSEKPVENQVHSELSLMKWKRSSRSQ